MRSRFPIKEYLEKFLFIIYIRNRNLSKFTVLCYNVTPVMLFKFFGVKSYIFSNHGIALELYKGLIRTSNDNILFINQANVLLKYLPKNWKYVYHVNKDTYKYILEKDSYTLITTGSTYSTNNKAILQKMALNSIYNVKYFRFMNEYDDICCQFAERILCIGTDAVVEDYKKQYGSKKVYQITNSSYLRSERRLLLSTKNEVVMVAGRGSYHKGVDVYFELARFYPDLTFNLIHLYDLENVDVPSNVIIHGFVKPTDPVFSEVCSRSKVSCFFSIAEGFPGSLCDTLAYEVLPLVPKSLGLGLKGSFEYDDFNDLILKFQVLFNVGDEQNELRKSLTTWKQENISIESFRLKLNSFLHS